MDLHGDPLPAGAVTRLGSTRFWHPDGVEQMAWSPDGQTIATSGRGRLQGEDRRLRIWTADGRLLHVIKGHEDGVSAIAFSPDGKLLASTANGDGVIRLWEVASGSLLRTLKGHSTSPGRLLFSPDGKALISVERDVRLWDLAGGRAPSIFRQPRSVDAIAFLPDGTLLAAGGGEETGVFLWDARTGKTIHELRQLRCWHLTLSPDGRILVSNGPDDVMRLWETSSGKLLRSVARKSISWPVLSFDGKHLAFSGVDAIALLDITSGKERRSFGAEHVQNYAMTFSADGKALAAVSHGDWVRLLDVATGRQLSPFRHEGGIQSAIWTPDGKSIITAAQDRTVRCWESATGRPIRMIPGPSIGNFPTAAITPDGRMLAEATAEGEIRLWDLVKGKVTRTMKTGEWMVEINISPDGRILAGRSWENDARVRLWNLQSGEALPALNEPRKAYSFTFSPDSRRLISMTGDNTIGFWDLQSRKQVCRMDAIDASSIAFARDGKIVAIGQGETKIVLRDVKTGQAIRTIEVPPRNGTGSLAFSPDGHTLAVAGRSSRDPGDAHHPVRLLDAATGKEVAAFKGHERFVHAVAFSPDGRSLLSVSADATGLIWKVPAARRGQLGHQIK
jgi:WD40 repeat protein